MYQLIKCITRYMVLLGQNSPNIAHSVLDIWPISL